MSKSPDAPPPDPAPTWLPRRGFLRMAGLAGIVAACNSESDESATPTTTSPTDGAATSSPQASATPVSTTTTSVPPVPTLTSDPFALGVASGDPLHDRVVIWTRLAPEPTDGGGMPAEPAPVRWVVADDEALTDLVAEGTARAEPVHGHSVHVDVDGLDPDRWYWYRFEIGEYRSPVARTRTTPAPGTSPGQPLRVAHASCQRWGSGYFTAYEDMAANDVDLVVHVGDYIYEYPSGAVRSSDLVDPITLDQYRAMWAHYKREQPLQAAHHAAPWITTWDDHEVENNYQGITPKGPSSTPDPDDFLARRAAAYQAWWEHTPTRIPPPDGPDLTIYRSFDWGDLARFTLLDTRQYRTDQPCSDVAEDVGPRCDEVLGPDATVLGVDQEAWLGEQMEQSESTWDVICQQVVMQQWRFVPGNTVWNLDQWDGYPVARDRALASLAKADDPIVLTGDVHSSWVGSLATDFDDPASELIGTEFVGPGISSDAPDLLASIVDPVLALSPHVDWAEVGHRGWVLHEITPDQWQTTYRFVDDPTVEGGTVSDGARFVVRPGQAVERA